MKLTQASLSSISSTCFDDRISGLFICAELLIHCKGKPMERASIYNKFQCLAIFIKHTSAMKIVTGVLLFLDTLLPDSSLNATKSPHAGSL